MEVSAYSENQMAVIAIRDNVCEMDAKFIHRRLFKLSTTTKGNVSMGIGVYKGYEFARTAGGKLTIVSQVGSGSDPLLAPATVGNEGTADYVSEANE